MTLELGDCVWYWNGQISISKEIPRATWFPGSNPHDPNDYLGHGVEIYQYVIHATEIALGQPHLRSGHGSFAWLDNNPGNITGPQPDFGQYPGKFNWHNFLIFPTWEAGFDAIARYLRTPRFVNLSILEAFRVYAPASDGNRPDDYADAVAAAIGVPRSTRVGDLDDNQMWVMQAKIQEIEGAIGGWSLAWDSEDIPFEIASLLPSFRLERRSRRPRALFLRSESFAVDMSAPVDVSGYTGGLGGPAQGGHATRPEWYIRYGMDLAAPEGTAVYAAFDGHVTQFLAHDPKADDGPVYGAQISMRSPNNKMGGFYTHLTNTPSWLGVGAKVSRGDYLGQVLRFGAISPHLHLALVEIIGGAPGGQYVGVDLYDLFQTLEASEDGTTVSVQFWQDGSPPEPIWRASRIGARFAPVTARLGRGGGMARPADAAE